MVSLIQMFESKYGDLKLSTIIERINRDAEIVGFSLYQRPIVGVKARFVNKKDNLIERHTIFSDWTTLD